MVFLANRIAFFLSRNGIIEEEAEPVYAYGAEIALSTIAVLFAVLLIGGISGQIVNLTIFMLSYKILRECAGGYHAGTHLRCFIYSIVICIMNVLLYIVLPMHTQGILTISLLVLSSIVLVISAPSQNLVNPKTKKELVANKKKMIVWIVTLSAITTVLQIIRIGENAGFPIACAFATVMILSVVNSLQYHVLKRRQSNG